MDMHIALNLLEIFADVERQLKNSRYLAPEKVKWAPFPLAKAGWDDFASAVGPRLQLDEETLRVLIRPGPKIELVVNGICRFEQVPFRGASEGEQAIHAARQVRNNLFHGGKLLGEGATPDDTFMQCAIAVLSTAREQLD